jgi:hypothetical protein
VRKANDTARAGGFAFALVLAACNALVGGPDPVAIPDPLDAGGSPDGTPAKADAGGTDATTPVDSSAETGDARTDAPPPDGSAPAPVLLVSNANLGDVDNLAVYSGTLYGTNNGANTASGPVWSVSTSGAGFQYLSPYNALINGIGAVRQMALSPPYLYFAVADVANRNSSTWGAWAVDLNRGGTTQVLGFYDGVILAADPAPKPNLYIADGRSNGFDGEPKAGDLAGNNQIDCNRLPAPYPAPLQIVTDASGNLFWAYNGTPNYGSSRPLVQQINQATPATVASWSHTTPCNGYLTLVTDVDVLGIGVDGTNVYWSEQTPSPAIRSIPYAGLAASRTVWTSPSFPAAEQPRALQSDGKYVYWVAGAQSVWAVAVDGSTQGSPIAVVGPAAGRTRITAMTFDDGFVYFADSGTYSIWKVAKPE